MEEKTLKIVHALIDVNGYGACALSPHDTCAEDAVERLMAHAPNLFTALQSLVHPMASDDDVRDAEHLLAIVRGDIDESETIN